jgi:hypothetical protein
MSVTDADDSDQSYEQVNGQLMEEMHQVAQQQDDDPEGGDR